MSESRINLNRKDLQNYVVKFEKKYNEVAFERQESGLIHNTSEWGSRIYDCLKNHDTEGMLEALNLVSTDYTPGKLSKEELRSGKNLIISLISVMIHFAVQDRIIDNEHAMTAADVCILLCEETRNREDLLRTAYAGLYKISDLIQSYHDREYHYLVKQAKEYVFKHLHEEIVIKNMANALGVTPEHLSRTFHQAEKITLKQYIIDERIERAKNLLRFSDSSIAEISQYLSFSSPSHFSEVFKRKTGKSPAEYRKDFSDSYLKRS